MLNEAGPARAAAGGGGDDVFVLPASFAQERMWFLERMAGGSAAYNMPVALRLRGALDPRALAAALAGIVRRHEVLRTTLPTLRGELVQVVRPSGPARWPLADLSALGGEAREREELRLRREVARRRFDLARGPLLRAVLVRMAADEHVALCTLHHAVCDGWSREVLARELGAGYAAALEGRPPPLPPLRLQYGDFARWQRRWLEGEACARQLAYWRGRLAGAPPAPELPADRPRAAAQDFRGATASVRLPEGTATALRELGRREGATAMTVFLAGLKVLLARYTGEDDVVVGTPVAGRTRPELEELVGLFVNTLALRTSIGADTGFREVVRRVRATTTEALAAQDVPFERVVQELRPETEPGRNPFFDVMFSYGAPLGGEMRLGDLSLALLEGGSGASPFDLALHVVDAPRGTGAWLTYRTALFEAGTAARVAGHFARLLEAAAAAPDAPWASLPLLPVEEERELVHGWNRTARDFAAADLPVHRRFEAQAARTPHAPAVEAPGARLTYAELDARANRLAHALRARGAGPEARVAVRLERSAELLVATLAVLKAGAAYVPLDPASPAERTAWVLRDCGAALLVAPAGTGFPGVETVPPDAGEGDVAGPPAAADSPRALAYVVYTSGSTGTPKGVLVEHAGLGNLLLGTAAAFGFAPGERFPVLASSAFDIWAFEAFSPLLAGGVARVLAADEVTEARLLAREAARADSMHAVPALMRQAAEAVREEGAAPSLRRVFTGGDTVPPELLAELAGCFPGAEVHVLYGPTEGTVLASSYAVPAGGTVHGHPIGVPLPNVRLYPCDRLLSPAPLGVAGELCIGGAGVARGYLGRPELTAEKFVPDPFSGEPGARMYRTGDRARRRADGVLEFLGRTDHQVKVRGFRIEPGEVEARLEALEGVRAAVVVAREDVPGERRLVGYVVGECDPAAARAALRGQLPEFMVPSALVVLDALPLNHNGKVDRARLPAPADAADGDGYLAPRDPLEEIVAAAWAELLGLPRVGVDRDVFELGASSLLVMRISARLRAALGVDVPVRAFFTHATVASLAGWIRGARGGTPAERGAIPRADRSRPLPLSFAQDRLWFLDQAEDSGAAYTMPFALRLEGEELDPAALARAFARVVERHEVLRTVFPADGGEGRQHVLPAGPFPLPVVELGRVEPGARGALVARAAAASAARPFDLRRGPLARATLLRLGPAEHVLLVELHHIVFDGWSGGVLMRELGACYAALRSGGEPDLPELPVQYADYAAWERSWAAGEAAAEQLAYWRRQLAGVPTLDLSGGRPRPPRPGYRGSRVPVAVPPELADRVRALARTEHATPFMVLLAAFTLVLAHRGRARDLAVGVDVAGRGRVETEPLVGFFINELVLRTDLAGDPSLEELLRRVRAATLDAYQNRDVPFSLVARELAGRRSLGTNPLFQVMFGLDNTPRPEAALPGLRTTPVAVGTEVSVFELCLYLTDTPGGFNGSLRFRTDLFDEAAAGAMRSDFLAVLDLACGDPARRVESVLDELAARDRARRVERARTAGEANRSAFPGIRRRAIPVTPTAEQQTP